MHKLSRIFLGIFFLLLFSSCSIRKTQRETEVIRISPEEKKETVDTIKVDVDTLPFTSSDTAKVDTFKAEPKSSEEVEFKFEEKPEEQKKIFGYRVQIFAFSDRERAEAAKEEAQLVLDKPVYVEYVPGFDGPYKVRVGDFISREEAVKYRDYLRRSGYPDAFIVETYINVH